jgi:uncharacterized membrane protein
MEDNITVRHLIGGYSPFTVGIVTIIGVPTIAVGFQPSQGWMMVIVTASWIGGVALSVATEKVMEYIGWR